MAKVSGPLFSESASGGYAGKVLFTKTNGKNYARKLVTSANKHTAEQYASRNYVRITAACQKWANSNTQINPALTVPDKQALMLITPPENTWNVFFFFIILGLNKASILDANDKWSYLGMSGPSNWNNAALALAVPFKSVKQTVAGGGPGSTLSAGYMFFVYAHGLYWAGLAPQYLNTPPVYT